MAALHYVGPFHRNLTAHRCQSHRSHSSAKRKQNAFTITGSWFLSSTSEIHQGVYSSNLNSKRPYQQQSSNRNIKLMLVQKPGHRELCSPRACQGDCVKLGVFQPPHNATSKLECHRVAFRHRFCLIFTSIISQCCFQLQGFSVCR